MLLINSDLVLKWIEKLLLEIADLPSGEVKNVKIFLFTWFRPFTSLFTLKKSVISKHTKKITFIRNNLRYDMR